MNTLSKTVTRTFFVNDEGFDTLTARWSALVNSPQRTELSFLFHVYYAALRGKDWRKTVGGSPITNATKLANGLAPYSALASLYSRVNVFTWNKFVALIGPDILSDTAFNTIKAIFPVVSTYTLPESAYTAANISGTAVPSAALHAAA